MPVQTPKPFVSRYNGPTTFADDFPGTALDANWWGKYNSPPTRDPANITVAGGKLLIGASGQTGTGMVMLTNVTHPGKGLPEVPYGRFECRIKHNPDNDHFPIAFHWPANDNWPEEKELDWGEAWGALRNTLTNTVHWYDLTQLGNPNHDRANALFTRADDYTVEHLFSVEILPDRVVYAIDNVVMYTDFDPNHIPSTSLNVRFQSAPGGANASTTTTSSNMEVRQMRVALPSFAAGTGTFGSGAYGSGPYGGVASVPSGGYGGGAYGAGPYGGVAIPNAPIRQWSGATDTNALTVATPGHVAGDALIMGVSHSSGLVTSVVDQAGNAFTLGYDTQKNNASLGAQRLQIAYLLNPPVAVTSVTISAVTAAQPPPVPSAPRAQTNQPGDGNNLMSWTPPASDGGSPVTGYTVAINAPVGAASGSVVVIGTDAIVTGLTNGAAYTYDVCAVNANGSSLANTSGTFTPMAIDPNDPTSLLPGHVGPQAGGKMKSQLTVIDGNLIITNALIASHGALWENVYIKGYVQNKSTTTIPELKTFIAETQTFTPSVPATAAAAGVNHAPIDAVISSRSSNCSTKIKMSNGLVTLVQPDVNMACVAGEYLGAMRNMKFERGADGVDVWSGPSDPDIAYSWFAGYTVWSGDDKHRTDGQYPGRNHPDLLQISGCPGTSGIGSTGGGRVTCCRFTIQADPNFGDVEDIINGTLGDGFGRQHVDANGTSGATVSYSSASAFITDSAVKTTDVGIPVTGTGIPAKSFVGTVTAGSGFRLSSSATVQTDVKPTATGSTVTIGYGPNGSRSGTKYPNRNYGSGCIMTPGTTNIKNVEYDHNLYEYGEEHIFMAAQAVDTYNTNAGNSFTAHHNVHSLTVHGWGPYSGLFSHQFVYYNGLMGPSPTDFHDSIYASDAVTTAAGKAGQAIPAMVFGNDGTTNGRYQSALNTATMG